MRIIAIGDTHGRNDWQKIIMWESFDKIVFIGDYFDTHEDISAAQQLSNFKDLLDYKKGNPDKVVLLVGNHDYHYMRGIVGCYSGYQAAHAHDIQDLLHKGLDNDLMQMCYVHENFMFTHAGVTETWMNDMIWGKLNKIGGSIEDFINDLFKYKPRLFGFTPGDRFNRYGDEVCQTPIWVRPFSLKMDIIDGYTQIVGHTMQNDIIPHGLITFIDTLGTSGEYLAIEDGEMSVLKLKK